MSVYQSRHTHYSKKAAPRKKRALPLYGEGEYKGKLYRCWNCGFINNADRAQVANTFQGGDRVQVFETDDMAPIAIGLSDTRYLMLTLDALHSINIMQTDANGIVLSPQVSAGATITGGCSFCGCMNYR
jgi:hypothetical protein